VLIDQKFPEGSLVWVCFERLKKLEFVHWKWMAAARDAPAQEELAGAKCISSSSLLFCPCPQTIEWCCSHSRSVFAPLLLCHTFIDMHRKVLLISWASLYPSELSTKVKHHKDFLIFLFFFFWHWESVLEPYASRQVLHHWDISPAFLWYFKKAVCGFIIWFPFNELHFSVFLCAL
jgi:hypothetical protein